MHIGGGVFEDAPLAPLSVYEQTKAAGDFLAGVLALDGLHVIRVRPFNHTGPGQTPGFVAPDFALQIAKIEAGQQAPLMKVGNLDAERDFLDVRDVADAYVSVIERSSSLETGTVLNIASGVPTKIESILDGLLRASTRRDIAVELEPARMRGGGNSLLYRRLICGAASAWVASAFPTRPNVSGPADLEPYASLTQCRIILR